MSHVEKSSDTFESFYRHGYTRLKEVFSASQASAMEDVLWGSLKRKHGIFRDDETTWHSPPGFGLRKLRTHPVFAPIGGTRLVSALNSIVGEGKWQRPKYWGSFLVSFPQEQGTKSRPNFHTDFPYDLPTHFVAGVLIIAFIGSVPPRGGGTLVVQGSHLRIAEFIKDRPHLKFEKMKVTRQALMTSDPYFRSFPNGWTEEDWVEQMPGPASDDTAHALKLVELTGEPGDVIVAHPWLLHSTAPNLSGHPRFMTVQRIARSMKTISHAR